MRLGQISGEAKLLIVCPFSSLRTHSTSSVSNPTSTLSPRQASPSRNSRAYTDTAAAVAQACGEAVGGAERQAQGGGDVGGALAFAEQAEDGAADGDRRRCWHGRPSSSPPRPALILAAPALANLDVVYCAANPMSRDKRL